MPAHRPDPTSAVAKRILTIDYEVQKREHEIMALKREAEELGKEVANCKRCDNKLPHMGICKCLLKYEAEFDSANKRWRARTIVPSGATWDDCIYSSAPTATEAIQMQEEQVNGSMYIAP